MFDWEYIYSAQQDLLVRESEGSRKIISIYCDRRSFLKQKSMYILWL